MRPNKTGVKGKPGASTSRLRTGGRNPRFSMSNPIKAYHGHHFVGGPLWSRCGEGIGLYTESKDCRYLTTCKPAQQPHFKSFHIPRGPSGDIKQSLSFLSIIMNF
uniref:Uncharacterized protein n=1 Tax=Rhizophora mucronata TaxID=61149 RepID=A0A2P2J1K7_RHIMU